MNAVAVCLGARRVTVDVEPDHTLDHVMRLAATKLRVPYVGLGAVLSGEGVHDPQSPMGAPNGPSLKLHQLVVGDVDPSYKQLNPDALPAGVVLSSDPDVVSLDDDASGVPRAALPCGHAVTANTMSTCLTRQAFHDHDWEVKCPGALCDEVIPLETAKAIAMLTPDELELVEEKVGRNYVISEMKGNECPECSSLAIRENDNVKKIECVGCQLLDKPFSFCWDCKQEWNNPHSTTECGNHCVPPEPAPAAAGQDGAGQNAPVA